MYTWIYDPNAFPMYMFAADAWVYKRAATVIIGNILNLEFLDILPHIFRGEDNWGFPVYIGFLYTYVLESVALILFLNVIIGSYTVVLMAKIADMLYSRKHAVMTGVMAMLMPALMWYGGMYLKETVMIFMTVLVVYHAVRMVTLRKMCTLSIAVILLAVPALHYFRSAIAVLLFLSLVIYLLLNFAFKARSKIVVCTALILFIVVIPFISLNMGQFDKIYDYYEGIGQEAEQRIVHKTTRVDIKTSVALPLVAANAFFAPYPSFTYLDERQINVISNAPLHVTRVLISYFGVLGLLILFRTDLIKSSIIIAYGAGYILILAITGSAMFSRYILPALPFIIIFTSVGVYNSSKKMIRYYDMYLIVIWVIILIWHFFKASIRGLL